MTPAQPAPVRSTLEQVMEAGSKKRAAFEDITNGANALCGVSPAPQLAWATLDFGRRRERPAGGASTRCARARWVYAHFGALACCATVFS